MLVHIPLVNVRNTFAIHLSLRLDALHWIAACHGEGVPADGEEGYEQGNEHGDEEQPPGEADTVGEEFKVHLRTLDSQGRGQYGGQKTKQKEGACQLP